MTEHTPDPDAGGAPADEPAHDPEVLQLAAQACQLARHGDTDRLAAYVDAGVPADLTHDRGDTLLMLAAYYGHAETVRALLHRGAEVDRPNHNGQTPLAGAVFKDAHDVIDALLEAGADPSAGTPSAIETARTFRKDELLKQFGVE